jgi:OOP family OmpA-OmpF porin
MKKFVIAAVVVCFAAAGYASVAKADKCEYHQWKRLYCKGEPRPEPKAAPAPVPEKLVLEGVYFDTGKATLKRESYSVLDRNADQLIKRKDVTITVVGYTDDVGNDASNQRLSENRASTVKNYLVSKGVAASRINSIGRGESNPVASNKTAEGRAQNRRIEIEILGK